MNLQLALFVARTRVLRNAAILLLIVSSLAIGVNGIVRMMQVPSWALADTTVGSADYAMQLPINGELPFDNDDTAGAAITAVEAAGATGAWVGYVGAVVSLDTTGEQSGMLQQPWASDPFHAGYVLTTGRLPSGLGEAAVSTQLTSTFPIDSTISMFRGALELRVVGAIESQAAHDTEIVAVDDGVLQDLSARSSAELGRYQIGFTPILYWSDAAPEQVAPAVASALGVSSPDDLLAGTVSHDAIAESAPPALVELDIVLTLIPVLAAIIATWIVNRFLRRLRQTLVQLGVSRTGLSLQGTVVLLLVIAAVAGGVVGAVLALASRPLLAQVSPGALDSPGDLVGQIMLIALVTAITVPTILVVTSFRPASSRRRLSGTRPWIPAAGGGVIFIVGMVTLQNRDINAQIVAMMMLSLALCIFGAYLLKIVPDRGGPSPWTLAMRRVRGEGPGTNVALIALGMILASGFTLATLYASDTVTSNDLVFERVPAGQAYFEPPQADAELLAEIEEFVGIADPVQFWFIDAQPQGANGIAMAVDSTDDVARLIQRPLTASESVLLLSGGALLTGSGAGDELRLLPDDGDEVVLPAVAVEDVPPSFGRLSGIALTQTAERAKLPLVRHTWVFTELTDEQRQKVEEAPGELGFDAQWLEGYKAADPFQVRGVLMLILAAVVVIGGCVVFVYAANTARALRPRAAALTSIGLSRGWLVRALTLEVGVIVLHASGIAAVAGALAIGIAVVIGTVPLRLAVPWDLIGAVVVALCAAAALAGLLSSRRLRLVERQDRW